MKKQLYNQAGELASVEETTFFDVGDLECPFHFFPQENQEFCSWVGETATVGL